MEYYIKLIIICLVVLIAVALVYWFFKNQCEQDVPARRVGDPTPFVHETISNRSSPHLPFISPYPPEPPPLGFGNSVDIPQPDIGFNANDLVDTYPPTRRASYPPQSGNNKAPYPVEASCYPPSARTAPYPVENSIPQPSRSRISYSSDRNTRETSNSTRIAPYPPVRKTPYPVTSSMPQPSTFRISEPSNSARTTPYPPAHQAPYPVTSSMPQPSTSRRCEPSNSTRIIPYTPADQAAYPPSSECIIPRPSRTRYSAERTTGRTRYSGRSAPRPPASSAPYPPASSAPDPPASSAPYPPASSAPYPPASSAPYPPASSASFSSELPPPTYEDAVNNKI